MSSFEEAISGACQGVGSTKDYYEALTSSADLKTNACCTSSAPPQEIQAALENVCDESMSKYYGCGLIYPSCIRGTSVLDLGCGAGRDVFVLSQLVGENGFVTGVDFSEEQLAVGQKHTDWQMRRFQYAKTNVKFVLSDIEDLKEVPDGSVDVVVSNCVVNLARNKRKVLSEVYRVLKQGGELYFSDVYSDRRMPQALRDDEVMFGECISGALYWNDFQRLAKECGFLDPRLVKSNPVSGTRISCFLLIATLSSEITSNHHAFFFLCIPVFRQLTVQNRRIEGLLGRIRIYSATYRLFKLPELEPQCEDYGQAVIYKGTVADEPAAFLLDGHHLIEAGKVFPVCGNTYNMLYQTRFQEHFTFIGDWSTHYGIFSGCGTNMPFDTGSVGGGCC